jgi:hypothetical protein
MKEFIKNKLGNVKIKIKNFLKDDFNNWYVRLCCLCFSLALIISSFVTVVEVWFVSSVHTDFVYTHPWKWTIICFTVFIFAGFQLWMSKLFYRLYTKIKTYSNVQNN